MDNHGDIPRQWSSQIGQYPFITLEYFTNYDIAIPIIKAQKALYNKIKKPTVQQTWVNIFPYLENLEWDKIYLLSYKITSEPFLQSLQYTIIKRILNSNERLFKWQITEDNVCNYLDQIDRLQH